MAGIVASVNVIEVALAAATAKTVLQLVAPANQRLRLKRWGVFFIGTSATAQPVKVRLLRQSTAGTMSASTPVMLSAGSETVQATAQNTATVEPTAGNVLDVAEVHPQSGFEVICPYDQPIEVPGGGRVGIELTAAAIVSATCLLVWEE